MGPDPYSGAPGVEEIYPGVYSVTVRLATSRGDKVITFKLGLMENKEESKLVFKPLLNRFMAGEEYLNRPVRISDSGRIRNELQTLFSGALEFFGETGIRIHFENISTNIISKTHKQRLLKILKWYKKHHPIWFSWLEIVES
jgi:hypothetical protein